MRLHLESIPEICYSRMAYTYSVAANAFTFSKPSAMIACAFSRSCDRLLDSTFKFQRAIFFYHLLTVLPFQK